MSMVSWDCKDKWVVTACSDYTLKVWDSFTGLLLQVLSGHKDDTFVLEGHPLDSQVIVVISVVDVYRVSRKSLNPYKFVSTTVEPLISDSHRVLDLSWNTKLLDNN